MSEIIILDTHIWLWYINSNFDQFPAHWRSRIESANQVGVSSLSCFEIALAHQKGRIELACPLLASIDSKFPQYSELDSYLMK